MAAGVKDSTRTRVVTLAFRRTREIGNFSIETSFEQMMRCFPADSRLELRKFRSSFESNGFLPRLRAILEARRHRGDVNHVTGDVHFLVLAFPRRTALLTVHDCGFMSHPNGVARRILKWFWLDVPIRWCRRVIAVSEATKADIIRYTGCRPEKIEVIPTVISDAFSARPKQFNWSFPRLLHVGLAPNKNFLRHVEAIAGLACHLRIVGKLGEMHREVLARHEIDYSDGYNLTEAEMVAEYDGCDALLFASTFEGFGMPILEAQAVGRPVITSDRDPMRQVSGGAALLVDPERPSSIRAAVKRLMSERGLAGELVARGIKNCARYQPAAVARRYAALYRSTLER